MSLIFLFSFEQKIWQSDDFCLKPAFLTFSALLLLLYCNSLHIEQNRALDLPICPKSFYLTVFVIVSSGEIRIGGQEHFYMETQSMLVVPVGEETEFNVYVSTQWPTLTQVHGYFD